jgi:hypothetical protein
MSFLEYIEQLLYSIIYRHRSCNTCMGSNGHCDKCDELTKNLYQRDWSRWHKVKF